MGDKVVLEMAQKLSRSSTIARGYLEARTKVYDLSSQLTTLTAEVEALREVIHRVEQWANAYPESVFIEPTDAERQQVTDTIGSKMVTKLHGSWGRHILKGVREILAARQPSTTHTNEAGESCTMDHDHDNGCVYPSDGRLPADG